jgi:hypothetical protein
MDIKSRTILLGIATPVIGAIIVYDFIVNRQVGFLIFVFYVLSLMLVAHGVILAMLNDHKHQLKDFDYRQNQLNMIYDTIGRTYNEQNTATDMATFFEEVLDAIPNRQLVDNKTHALFKNELQDKFKRIKIV